MRQLQMAIWAGLSVVQSLHSQMCPEIGGVTCGWRDRGPAEWVFLGWDIQSWLVNSLPSLREPQLQNYCWGFLKALPAARRPLLWALPSPFPLVNHVLNLFLRGRRDGFILSQSFQGQADCPRHRVLRRMGEKEAATRSMPSASAALSCPTPSISRGWGSEVANVSHSVLPGLSFVLHKAFLISTV